MRNYRHYQSGRNLRENRNTHKIHRGLKEGYGGFGENEYVDTINGYEVYDLGDGCFALERASVHYGDDGAEIEVGFWEDDLTDDSYRFDFPNCEFTSGRHSEPINIWGFLYQEGNGRLTDIFAPYLADLCGLGRRGNEYDVDLDTTALMYATDGYNGDELENVVFGADVKAGVSNEVVTSGVVKLINNSSVTVPAGFEITDALANAIALDIQEAALRPIRYFVSDSLRSWCEDVFTRHSVNINARIEGYHDSHELYLVFNQDGIGTFLEWLAGQIYENYESFICNTKEDFEAVTREVLSQSYDDFVYSAGLIMDVYEEVKNNIESYAWNYINWDNVRRNLNRTTNESYRRHYTRRSPRTIRESINRRPYNRHIYNRTSYRR